MKYLVLVLFIGLSFEALGELPSCSVRGDFSTGDGYLDSFDHLGREYSMRELNKKPLNYFEKNISFILEEHILPFVVVPGIADDDQAPGFVHKKMLKRAALAATKFHKGHIGMLIVSGGNVHPVGTYQNESMDLKNLLVEKLQVPADRIFIEPFARHTTTNVRNAGRLLLSLGVSQATILTTYLQSFYISLNRISGFYEKYWNETNHELPSTRKTGARRTLIDFNCNVFTYGNDPLDF